jgi:hypothetical protein
VFVACSGRKLAYALVENMLMQLCSFAVVEKLLMYLVFCSIFVVANPDLFVGCSGRKLATIV